MTSTPISKLPIQTNSSIPEEEDPEVLAILQEMQQPENIKQLPQPISQPSIIHNHIPKPIHTNLVIHTSSWYNHEIGQKAIIAALIAYFIFTLKSELIYNTIPSLQKIQSYDLLIRMFLLAVILYFLMLQFKL